MSRTIDERVVSMEFDNRQFEKNVATSMSTLDKLKQSLNLDKSAKSFDDLNASAKKIDLSFLSKSAETIGLKFNAMYTMADQAFRNITNSAMNYGKQIINSLTIDPVKAGFSEYELKMGSIQTIMSSTGESLETVNKYLNELNTYSDKTIYSFSDMTSNIGKFTNAGVDLETSVKAIQGISNVAAISGANAGEASRAMYNFSQALSAGYVKLMDWKSIENANMATVGFKNELIASAVAAGQLTDAGDGMYKTLKGNLISATKGFNESLTDGWMTTEVLTATLGRYSDETTEVGKKAFAAAQDVKTFSMMMDTLKESAQSGWATTWELLVGDFEEGKSLWTKVSGVLGDIIGKSADARNDLIRGWKEAGGRDDLIAALSNAFKILGTIIRPIKAAFKDIFPPVTVEQLTNFTKKLRELTEKFLVIREPIDKVSDTTNQFTGALHLLNDKMSVEEADSRLEKLKTTISNITKVFKGLFSALSLVIKVIKAVASGIFQLIKIVAPLGEALLEAAAAIGEWVTGLNKSAEETGVFTAIIDKIVGVVEAAANKIRAFFGLFKSDEDDGAPSFLESIWNGIQKLVGNILNALGTFGSNLAERFRDIFNNLGIQGILDIISKVLMGGLILKVSKFFTSFKKAAETGGGLFDKIGEAIDGFKDALGSLSGALNAFAENLRAKSLLTIAAAIGILALSLIMLSGIESEKLNTGIGAITALFTDLVMAMSIFKKMVGKGKGLISASTSMIAISIAVLILSSALKKLAKLSPDDITKSVQGVLALTAIIVAAAKLLASNGKKTIKGAFQMVILTLAVKQLAGVCEDLAKMPWNSMKQGLIGVGALLAEIAAFMYAAKGGKMSIGNAVGMVVMAASLEIIFDVCDKFAAMSPDKLKQGLVAVGALFAGIALYSHALKSPNELFRASVSMTIMAYAIDCITPSLMTLGSMSWSGIFKGIIAIEGMFLAIAFASHYMSGGSMFDDLAVMLSAVGVITALGEAMKILGEMSWGEFFVGISALASSLLVLTVSMKAMKGCKSAAGSLLFASIALIILAGAIKLVAGIGVIGAAVSLITMAGALAAITIAAKKVSPYSASLLKLSVSILAFSGSLTVLGVALAAVGVGIVLMMGSLASVILMFSGFEFGDIVKGLAALAGVFVVLGVAAKLLRPMLGSILSLSGSLVILGLSCLAVAVAIGIIVGSLIALGSVGPEAMKDIVASLDELVIGILKMLPAAIKYLGESLKQLVLSLVDVLVETAPAIVDGILVMINSTLEALSKSLPKTLQFIGDLILGLLDMLVKYAPEIIDKLVTFIIKIIDGIAARIPDIVKSIAGLFSSIGASIDTKGFLELTIGLGLMAGVIKALSLIKGAIPGAMVGVLGVGVILAEMALIFAALGGLAQIPGLKWLIDEGAGLMRSIGNAIGSFVGGLVGGIMGGISAALPQIGKDLSDFMTNALPFINGAKEIDSSVLEGVLVLAGVILALTAANILEGLTSWFTGGSSIADFGKELADFGPYLKQFSDSVVGIDPTSVTAAAEAAKTLSEMAETIPKEGGLAAWFAGENSLAAFGPQIASFGEHLASFASSVAGMDTTSVVAAAEAGKALADMASTIPNEGGVAAWFAGDNSLAAFGPQVASFGEHLATFASSVSGVDPASVIAASEAGKALAEMASTIPNEGGVAAWFAGDNSLASFGPQVAEFGSHLATFANDVSGIDPVSVVAATVAARALAEMADVVPNEGGIVSWFAGDNSLASFGPQIASFGKHLGSFATSVRGIDSESVSAAAQAGKALAEMASFIPNEGGIASWFAGDSSLTSFGPELEAFGPHLAAFASHVTGIDPATVSAAAQAGKALGEMVSFIPNEGGITAWFAGESGFASFGPNIASFGKYLASFAASVTGMDTEAVSIGAEAGKTLAEMASFVPNEGGVVSWFAGDNSLAAFGPNIASFGEHLASFATHVAGMDTEAVSAAAKAAASLVEMANNVPNEGGIVSWFAGDNSLAAFGPNIASFGLSLALFGKHVAEIKPEAVTAAAEAGKTIAEMASLVPNEGGIASWFAGENSLAAFGPNIAEFGKHLAAFATNVAGIQTENLSKVINQTNNLVNMLKNMSGISSDTATTFVTSFETLSKNGISQFTSVFANAYDDVRTAISEMITVAASAVADGGHKFEEAADALMNKFIVGINSKNDNVKEKCTSIVSNAVREIKTLKGTAKNAIGFYGAGQDLVQGLINGMNSKKEEACNTAYEIGEEVVESEKRGQKSNSPSKATIQAGKWLGEGLIIGMERMGDAVYNAGENMGNTASNSISSAISTITDTINNDIDTQPTIRPVLDLSNIESGSRQLSAMFSRTQALSVNSEMNAAHELKVQNGESVAPTGNTYQFTQNNYSPKALSRGEIYRQTKNQFSAMERMVPV